MSETKWEQMIKVLEAMKPVLIMDDGVEQGSEDA